MKWQSKKLSLGFAVAFVVVVCITVIASRFFIRFDLTDDSVYTLSEGSHRIAAKLEDQVMVKLYFSESRKDLPPVFKAYGNRVEEVFREYASLSNNMISVEVIDPKPDSDEEVQARKFGIQGVGLASGDEAYLGAVLLSGDKEIAIEYFDPRNEEMLEYDISEALVKLNQTSKPKLAIYSSLPVTGGTPNPMQRMGGNQEWAVLTSFRNFFDVQQLSGEESSIPKDTNLVVLIHPKALSESFEYAIDQFLLGGGRLIIMVDPFSRIDLAMNSQAMMRNPSQPPSASSNFERLFKAWGLGYDPSQMVGDPQLATRISMGMQTISYPFFMSLGEDQISSEDLITTNLKQMLLGEAGWFDVSQIKENLNSKILLHSTENTGTVSVAMANFMGPQDLSNQLEVKEQERSFATLLTGKFPSAFTERPANIKDDTKHRTEAASEAAVVAIADVDFIHDSNAVERMRFINQIIMRPRNDNLNFVMNAAEALGGSQDLIGIRKSGRIQRPFTKVIELQQEAQKRWKAEDEKLSKQLNELQAKLRDLQSQRTDNNQALLSPEQQREIQRFREQEADIRTQRRRVRKNLREDIENLGRTLIAINLLLVPSIVTGLGISVFYRRSKRAGG